MAPDVTIASNDLSQKTGMPLIAIARNELQLLPDFLSHYRALGVRRFFILDDASTDDSVAYLSAQPDVCLLQSSKRYGEKPAAADLPEALRHKPDLRMVHQWRTALMNRFCDNQWAVQCDVDEFLVLPTGLGLEDLAQRLIRDGAQGAWGGMIDLYPRSISDMASYPATRFTHPRAEWFYDGARHFSLRSGKPPRHHYIGVRHRLDVAFAGKADVSRWAKLKLRLRGRRKAPSGTLVKPVFQHWQRGAFYYDSHRTTLGLSDQVLLPLLHYRYTPAMLSKLEWATQEGGYSKGNADYRRVEGMLAEMRRQNARFDCALSRPVRGFDDFCQTGNARY